MFVYSAIGTGSGVLIAQAYGHKDMGEVSAIAALGLIVAGVSALYGPAPRPFSGSSSSLDRSRGKRSKRDREFFQLFAASAPLVVMTAVSAATFRSLSDTRTPMVITMGAVALNTLLSFLLSWVLVLFQSSAYLVPESLR